MPFVNPADLPVLEPRPGWRGRFFHSAHMTHGVRALDSCRVIVVDHPARTTVGGVDTR